MGVTVALVVSIALGVVAFFQRQAAVAAEATAVTQRDRAVSAEATAVSERDRADLNSKIATSRELASASVASLDVDPERSVLLALQAVGLMKNINQPILPEIEDAVRRAVQASRVRYVIPPETGTDTNSVAFSPDGNSIAIGGWDGNVHVYDFSKFSESQSDSIKVEQAFNYSVGGLLSIAYSPDGTKLAIAGNGHNPWSWMPGLEKL